MLDRSNGTSNVNVTLTWDENSVAISSLTELLVARWDGSKWIDHGNGSTTGNTNSGTVTSEASVTSFSPFALASSSPVSAVNMIHGESGKKAYPNPVSSMLTIEIDEGIIQDIIVFDAKANVVGEFKRNPIDFSNFSSGVYFLNVILNTNEVIPLKVIRQ